MSVKGRVRRGVALPPPEGFRNVLGEHPTCREEGEIAGDKGARHKLSLLAVPNEMSDVFEGCWIMDYSGERCCEIGRKYRTDWAEGLFDRLHSGRGSQPNWVSEEIEVAS